jgi:hypothetical protein
VKLFKKLTLVFTTLLVVAFSFNFTKSFGASNSYQPKSVELNIAAIDADDIRDDFDDTEFEILYELPTLLPYLTLEGVNIFHTIPPAHSPIPFYLQIRNLRI